MLRKLLLIVVIIFISNIVVSANSFDENSVNFFLTVNGKYYGPYTKKIIRDWRASGGTDNTPVFFFLNSRQATVREILTNKPNDINNQLPCFTYLKRNNSIAEIEMFDYNAIQLMYQQNRLSPNDVLIYYSFFPPVTVGVLLNSQSNQVQAPPANTNQNYQYNQDNKLKEPQNYSNNAQYNQVVKKKNKFGVLLDYVNSYDENFEFENSFKSSVEADMFFTNKINDKFDYELGIGYSPLRLRGFENISGHKVSLFANAKLYPYTVFNKTNSKSSSPLSNSYLSAGLYVPFTYFNYDSYVDYFWNIKHYEMKYKYVGVGISARSGVEFPIGNSKADLHFKGTYEYLDGSFYGTLSLGAGFLF